MASVFGTSSPSYPILASMDAARAWLEGDGARAYRQTALRVAQLRRKFPSLAGDLSLDPARLTLNVQDGPSFAHSLEEQNIFPEMEDGGHVVFICTPQDLEENFDRLERALEGMEDRMGPCSPLPSPPLPERACSLREALFAPTQLVPLYQSAGGSRRLRSPPIPPACPWWPPGSGFPKKNWPISGR